MHSGIKFGFIFIILLPLLLLGKTNINISPQYSYLLYDSQLQFSNSHVYGINIQFIITDDLSADVGFSTFNTYQMFDVVGGQSSLNINANMYRVNLIYSALKLSEIFTIKLSGGLGAITLKSNRFKVDLGALGYRFIEPNSSTHFLYSFGIPVLANIFKNINFFIKPEIIMFNTNSKLNKNYNMTGGLTFDIF